MGKLQGLVWKEWMQYKGIVILSIIGSVFGTIVSPYLLKRMIEVDEPLSDILLLTSSVWMYVYILFFFCLFFASLEKDMKRPDIWFHNSSSTFTLIGAKLIAVTLFSLPGLVMNGIITVVGYDLLVEVNNLGFTKLLLLEFLLIGTTYLLALSFTIGLLTMWVLGRVLKPFNTFFSYVVAVVVYFYFYRSYLRFIDSELYHSFSSHWKLPLPYIESVEVTSASFAVFMDINEIYLFDLLVKVIFFCILFLLSVLVIQKRVRGFRHD